MTERFRGLLVTFAKDVREDDAECHINAIRMIKGVLNVEPVPSNIDAHISEERVRHELHEKLFNVIYPKKEK